MSNRANHKTRLIQIRELTGFTGTKFVHYIEEKNTQHSSTLLVIYHFTFLSFMDSLDGRKAKIAISKRIVTMMILKAKGTIMKDQRGAENCIIIGSQICRKRKVSLSHWE
jgi:hypothetical protein